MCSVFFFQAEDGIRDLVRSRGLGDVYKRQDSRILAVGGICEDAIGGMMAGLSAYGKHIGVSSSYGAFISCLLYTSDAADERSSVDLGGRRIIQKKKNNKTTQKKNTTNNKTNIYIQALTKDITRIAETLSRDHRKQHIENKRSLG